MKIGFKSPILHKINYKMEQLPKEIDKDIRYIICPDLRCKGWYEKHLRCLNTKYTLELFPNDGYKLCPKIDKAKSIVFCHYGHPIEFKVNESGWTRADCDYKNCYSMTFTLGSNTYIRIPLKLLNKFLKLPFKLEK
jgi:hypothetical protein